MISSQPTLPPSSHLPSVQPLRFDPIAVQRDVDSRLALRRSATTGQRIMALLLDAILIESVGASVWKILQGTSGASLVGIWLGLATLYLALSLLMTGRTLGHAMVGLRVIRNPEPGRPFITINTGR